MPVNTVRKELAATLPAYKMVRDSVKGQEAVKAGGKSYLPQPNATDTSAENNARYAAYLQRAVFYGVTGRTLRGLLGQVFMKPPVVELPSQMEMLITDASGDGVTIEQLSKRSLADVLSFGRSGLFVDYPAVDGSASVADLESGNIRPTIKRYAPANIINWRTISRGARQVLSLVVLQELYTTYDDGFELTEAFQYRVLKLDVDGFYTVEVWRTGQAGMVPDSWYRPTDASGALLSEIPFTFIGSENNDSDVDYAPLYDLAALNIAHYCNSADYEEACFIVGQPTLFAAGLTQQWVDDVLKGTVALGSRACIPLPAGGTAGILQVSPNTMAYEAMEHKERQMVAIGAKLVEQKEVQRTATEASMESASQNSILASCAGNVSDAFKRALIFCAAFVGVDDSQITFELSKDYDISRMSATERAQVMSEWMAGGLTWGEMRNALKRAGDAYEDDDKAKQAIEAETVNGVTE